MAIAIGFGVLFATFITLLMVPCLYLILEDVLLLFQRFLRIFGINVKRRAELKTEPNQLA
jgi:hypothetical protein